MKRLSAEQGFAVADDGGARKKPAAARDDSSTAAQLLADNIEKGIRPEEGMEALARVLAHGLRGELMLTSLPLTGLCAAQAAAEAPAGPLGERFARPELDNDYVEPRDDLERGLVHFWEELLGIDSIGVTDDFFALGGHSLIAVRLFAKIKKAYRIDYPMSVLFEAPTIEALANMLRRDGVSTVGDGEAGATADQRDAPRSRHRHLVAMHSGNHSEATPFFLVAGMFGNVLNLRHLAQLVGEDRPFYGLQARGLFGDMAPHETFEEAARDYLAEVRSVQPHGPYLLGGFSGGGIAAYEMARQLREAGEEVALLVLLDTPLPDVGPVGRADRLKIHRQHLREEGFGYLSRWVKNRFRWEVERWRRRFGDAEERAEPSTFHSQAIEQAFRRALGRYRVVPQDLETWLFRPVLDRRYDLGDGRYANRDRELVFEDNGWGRFIERLRVVETPGDHDSMVLEPNVRSLAGELRRAIEAAVATAGAAESPRQAAASDRPAVKA